VSDQGRAGQTSRRRTALRCPTWAPSRSSINVLGMPELALNNPLGGLAALWACERFMGRRIHFTQPHCLLVNIARAAIVDYQSGAMVDASASWGSLVGLAPNRVGTCLAARIRGGML
jgi:hypothetical protein